MDKKKALEKIAREIEKCKICPLGKSGKSVPGEGSPDAKIIFIGEAPGRQEALIGRPFVGRSGKFLRGQIQEIGLREHDVFITSPVKYLPDKGTPSSDDILHGRIHLEKQLTIIDPKIIVLLGSVACQAVLQEKIPVSKDHGKVIKRNRKKYFISYHPSAAIRFQKIKILFIQDFKKLLKEI